MTKLDLNKLEVAKRNVWSELYNLRNDPVTEAYKKLEKTYELLHQVLEDLK